MYGGNGVYFVRNVAQLKNKVGPFSCGHIVILRNRFATETQKPRNFAFKKARFVEGKGIKTFKIGKFRFTGFY